MNPIGPVSVPTFPGFCADITPSDTATFPPSVIVAALPGTITVTPASPNSPADVQWEAGDVPFIVPGLYIAVKATGTTSNDIKRFQIHE